MHKTNNKQVIRIPEDSKIGKERGGGYEKGGRPTFSLLSDVGEEGGAGGHGGDNWGWFPAKKGRAVTAGGRFRFQIPPRNKS